MKRAFLAPLLALGLAAALTYAAPAKQQSTKDKIAKAGQELKSSQKEGMQLSQKIDEIAGQIVKEQEGFKKREGEIKQLSETIEGLKDQYAAEAQELEKLNSQNITLLSVQNDLESKIISVISQELSFDLITDVNSTTTPDSIVASEILEGLGVVMNDELKGLIKDYENNQNFINEQNKKIKSIEASMAGYDKKKTDLNAKQTTQKEKLAQMKKDKEDYIARLEKINDEQDAISKTLQELKIIDDAEEKAKAQKEETARQAKLEAQKQK